MKKWVLNKNKNYKDSIINNFKEYKINKMIEDNLEEVNNLKNKDSWIKECQREKFRSKIIALVRK